MINSISSSIISPSGELPHAQQPPLNSNNKITDYITHAYNQPLSLEKLPTETIQNIAFKLDLKSYCNLRSTSHGMRVRLSPARDFNKVITNRYSGELKENYLSMYKKTIIPQIENEKNDDLLDILESISIIMVAKRNPVFDHPFITIKSLVLDPLKKKNYDILSHWFTSVTDSCNHLNASTSYGYRRCIALNDPDQFRLVKFDTTQLKKEDLDLFIKTFNTMFIEQEDNQRFILAVSAFQLIRDLKFHTPINISNADVTQYESQYPILFEVGKIVKNHVSVKRKFMNII